MSNLVNFTLAAMALAGGYRYEPQKITILDECSMVTYRVIYQKVYKHRYYFITNKGEKIETSYWETAP